MYASDNLSSSRAPVDTADFSLLEPSTRDLTFGAFWNWQVARASVEFYRVAHRAKVPNGWGIGGELGIAHASDPALAFAFNTSLRLSYTWSL